MSVTIPAELRPRDGRFGSGPSKVPAAAVEALAATGTTILGTSHRQAPVRSLVARVRAGLAELFELPDGYEVLLGNGGSTAFWDAAAFGLVRERVQHLVLGEFSAKFAAVTAGAPFLAEPRDTPREPRVRTRVRAEAGRRHLRLAAERDLDRGGGPGRPGRGADSDAIMLVDATSAAGGMAVDVAHADAYYFAPQKAFAGEAGIWLALVSPAAVDRVAELGATRWQPPSLDLRLALRELAP